MLAQRPLVALDGQAAVLADRYGATPAPLRWPITHQLPPTGIDAPALLVAGQGRGRGDEASLDAAEQQGLAPQVLDVVAGYRHQRRIRWLHP